MKKLFFPILLLALSACNAKAGNQENNAQAPQSIDETVEVQQRVPAPDFTLNDINGQPLSLSDLRGKWVILDFWGSWCPWCIKGFPGLKEAYRQYAGKVEILGIDCRDSEQVWKDAVKKYELPWLQVYNPGDNNILEQYQIQGFPTKFIIDPEGNVANVTIGEDPEFFSILSDLLN